MDKGFSFRRGVVQSAAGLSKSDLRALGCWTYIRPKWFLQRPGPDILMVTRPNNPDVPALLAAIHHVFGDMLRERRREDEAKRAEKK